MFLFQYPSTFSYIPNSKYDWNFTTVYDGYTALGHRNQRLELTSGKMLGGDSSLGHLLYTRGDPHDYNDWAKKSKDAAWNYENLLQYFKKSEDLQDTSVLNSPSGKFHGTGGKVGITRHTEHINMKYLYVFKEAGHDIILDGNGDKTLGYYEPMVMVRDGVRQSMAYSFLTPIKKRKNLHVLKETEAIEINFNSNRAIGVTAVKNGNTLKLKARREVIVSAGTMKSPQLLMLSGIGITDQLESSGIPVKKHLPVGRNYQDHIGVMMVHRFKVKSHKTSAPDPHEYPLPIIIGSVALNKNKPYPEYQSLNYIISSDSDSLLNLCSVCYSFKNEICQSLYEQTKGYETMVSKIVLLHPESRGHVVLQSKDYRDPPMILPEFYSHDEDLANMIKYIADFLSVNKTNVFRKLGGELVHPKLKECENYPEHAYWECYALHMMGTSYHYTSSCSMGQVVDSRLKVYGISGLRVVDASVIPLITSGNTQAAVMAVAEKGADMILEDANNDILSCNQC